MTAVLRDETDARKLLSYLKIFEKYSGMKFNQTIIEEMGSGIKKNSVKNILETKKIVYLW